MYDRFSIHQFVSVSIGVADGLMRDMVDVSAWLRKLGLERYKQVFRDNEITGAVLPELTDADLKEIGLPLGPRKLLLKAITELRVSAPTAGTTETTPASDQITSGVERRQLTVLFCDLVGSTELSARLDPEDMREVIRAYQNSCSDLIARFEGFVAKFMGDGMLAYFGYPRSHEDEAERAARAGLALSETIGQLKASNGEALAARVGIATGLVVVGDLIGEGAAQEQAVVGDTPNLAARLQGLAEPGQVVIGEATRQLIGAGFLIEDLGIHDIKGLSEPVTIFAVKGECVLASRFDARSSALLPMVGRDQELALLLERWALAESGEGQGVLLVGEAGIGKSRIVRALQDEIANSAHVRILCQCTPYHIGSALWPVIQQLTRAARLAADEPGDEQLDKLEVLLAQAGTTKGAPLIASLVGLESVARYGELGLTPQAQRSQTLEALVEQMLGLAEKQPVLVVFEDGHWIDPTTFELIEQCIDRIGAARVLLVITTRPDQQPVLAGHPHVTRLTLNRLGRAGVAAIIAEVGGEDLGSEVIDAIIARTDGVALFVEELTKAIVESGDTSIPASLHDSLMTRLDRATDVKEIAQVAACIGREFDYSLLTAISGESAADLNAALTKLADAELIFRRGVPPVAHYTFKHALVQDTAYASLLRSRRQVLHGRIGDALTQQFPDRAEVAPEVVAQHYASAGLNKQAISYWYKAGERAVRRSANTEAVHHLSKGLTLVESLQGNSERAQLELALQAQLGPALIASKGYGAPETANCFERARELTNEVGDSPQFFPVLYGCWVYKLTWAEYPAVRQQAEKFLSLAEDQADDGAILTGHRILGFSLSCLGEFLAARQHFEQVLVLYDPDLHATLAYRYGQDPKAAAAAMLGWNLWHLGYPDQAVKLSDEAVAYARELNHANTRGYVETFGAVRVHLFRRDRQAVQRYVDSMTELCEHQKLVFWAGFIDTFDGWAIADQGRYQEAIARIDEGLAAFEQTSTEMFRPHAYSLLAQAHAGCRQTEESLRLLDRALALAETTNEHWILAELHRLKGETLLQQIDNPDNQAVSEACFQTSLEIARERQAKSWELRAATSLARLWGRQGERQKAHDLLAPVYGWFTEGFDTADLKDAAALLSELS